MTDQAGRHEGAENFCGPYESWMLKHGKDFDLPALLLDKEAAISAVAEWPGGFDATSTEIVAKVGARDYPTVLPQLWTGGSSPEKFNPSFVPFLFLPSGKGKEQQTPSNPTVEHQATSLQTLQHSMSSAGQPDGDGPYFRVTFPLFHDTVDDQRNPGVNQPSGGPKELSLSAPSVIMAVIDDGIPFAHANFRASDGSGTRVDYCWSQGAPSRNDGSILFGREFSKQAIDRLVEDHKGDEDAVYRQAGALSQPGRPPMSLSRMHAHGAHVLDTATGRWTADSDTKVRIVAVELPSSAVWDTSGFGTDMFVLSAMHYIFDRADRIAEEYGVASLPLVINFSFGTTGGPHDGSSAIEAAIQEMIAARRRMGAPTALVMPSGNIFLDRTHAVLTERHFDKKRSAKLTWLLPPGDRTSSFMEMWLPEGVDPSGFSFALTDPDGKLVMNRDLLLSGEANSSARPGYIETEPMAENSRDFGQFSIDKYRNHRWRIMIALAPTEFDGDRKVRQPAKAGKWTIELVKKSGTPLPSITDDAGHADKVAGGIQCFIQRDIQYGSGNTGAVQSYFLDPLNIPYNKWGGPMVTDSVSSGGMAFVRRFGSLNGMATGDATLVAGGFNELTGMAALYSSAGALRYDATGFPKQIGKQVTVSAVTERSPALPGVVAAGTRSGIMFSMNGTSVAAPLISRQLCQAFVNLAPGYGQFKATLTNPADTYVSLLSTIKNGVKKTKKQGFAGPDSDERVGKLLVRLPRPNDRDDQKAINRIYDQNAGLKAII
ncbi:hypothetical protein [Hoeflea sp. AS16]|uniref:hypothetical protein n=1 Tax=Hoeflea sp. AS16 TaxID=3135779 RepID=UPI00316D1925